MHHDSDVSQWPWGGVGDQSRHLKTEQRIPWCDCVKICMTCTGSNGGTGARPPDTMDGHHVYIDNIHAHGICAPPPLYWQPHPPSEYEPPPPSPWAKDEMMDKCTEDTCPAPRTTPDHATCKPACVDCLVNAAQYRCGTEPAECPQNQVWSNVLPGTCRPSGHDLSGTWYSYARNSFNDKLEHASVNLYEIVNRYEV